MLAGEDYVGAGDAEIAADLLRAALLVERFNASSAADPTGRRAILAELLGRLGEDAVVLPPLHCDLGFRTVIGPRTFVNAGLVALDIGAITIGADCQIGPGVQLLTPTHPTDPGPRRAKVEGSRPITLGDNVWLGGGAIVCPGVTIGEDTVVGAGSVVVREGDEHGIGFFIVASGEGAVTVSGNQVATVKEGDYFGEVALVSDRVRTATVTATTDLTCLVMAMWDFRAFVRSDAEVAWGLLQHFGEMLHNRK